MDKQINLSFKESNISELKELTLKLCDRDFNLKKNYNLILNIINNKNLTDKQKISKIKRTVDGK